MDGGWIDGSWRWVMRAIGEWERKESRREKARDREGERVNEKRVRFNYCRWLPGLGKYYQPRSMKVPKSARTSHPFKDWVHMAQVSRQNELASFVLIGGCERRIRIEEMHPGRM